MRNENFASRIGFEDFGEGEGPDPLGNLTPGDFGRATGEFAKYLLECFFDCWTPGFYGGFCFQNSVFLPRESVSGSIFHAYDSRMMAILGSEGSDKYG